MLALFERHCRTAKLFPPGSRVLLAVSGGCDSMVLLDLLHRLAPTLQLQLTVAHLDHALRPESADEAQLVATTCARLGIPCVAERHPIPASLRRELGLEAAARQVRHRFLQRVADRAHCDLIALAHHRSDQAETLLYRLVRGTGLTGLAGMAARSGRLVRPLLPFSRDQLRRYARRQHLRWCEDPSNADLRRDRNLLRHEVLPLLRQLNPQVERSLAELAAECAAEVEVWTQDDADWLAPRTLPVAGGVRLALADLRCEPAARQLRLLRQLVQQVRGTLTGIGRRQLQALQRLATKPAGDGILLWPDLRLQRQHDQLLVSTSPEAPASVSFELTLDLDQTLELPDGARLSLRRGPGAEGPCCTALDPDAVHLPLQVRSRRPGDRIQLPGVVGRSSVKKLLIDSKVPRSQRAALPVVCDQGEILWVAGVRRAVAARPPVGSKRALCLAFQPPDGAEDAL